MRRTYCIPAVLSNQPEAQTELEKVWSRIEDNEDLNWRVEHNGDLTLEVDSGVPEHLKGTYIIKGVYTHKLHLITPANQKREYNFVQEGF